MKIILPFVLALLSFASSAATSIIEPKWELVTVTAPATTLRVPAVVGYIYHTTAPGHVSHGRFGDQIVSELRLICSGVGKPNPIIAIFRNGEDATIDIVSGITIKVDRKVIEKTAEYEWTMEGPLVYRKYEASPELLAAMQTGHMISFNWDKGAESNSIVFSLTGYQQNLGDFTTACKL